MRKTATAAVVSIAVCLLSLPLPLRAKSPDQELQEMMYSAHECGKNISPTSPDFVKCLNDFLNRDDLHAISEELDKIDTPTLRYYQFSTGLCTFLDCHSIPVDTVQSLISREIGFRVDEAKNRYTFWSTLTGGASMCISLLSLYISLLTYRRGSPIAKGVPASGGLFDA
jgi:hypothetical protein